MTPSRPEALEAGAAALAALDVLPEATAVVAVTGAVLYANRSWSAAVSDAVSLAPVPTWPQLLQAQWGAPAADVETAVAAAASLSAGGPPHELRWSRESAGGLLWLAACLRALPGQPGPLLLQLRDVTAEQILKEDNARLLREVAEGNERLRCFAAITSETLVVNEKGKILFANDTSERMFGITPEEAVGRSVIEFAAPECHDEIVRHLSKSNDDEPYEAVCIRRDGTRFAAQIRGRLISYHGRPVRGAALLDITERRQVENALRERLLAAERVRAQADALAALSTPLIPIREDVLVVPLIGELDSGRMAGVTEVMLSGISERRARCAILDVTGVPTLDGTTAAALVRAAQGGRLLGAQVVLSGVRADVAHKLVATGADLSGLTTYRSLQSAIAAAFAV